MKANEVIALLKIDVKRLQAIKLELECRIKEIRLDHFKDEKPIAYIHRNEYGEYRLEPVDGLDISTLPINQDIPLYKTKRDV